MGDIIGITRKLKRFAFLAYFFNIHKPQLLMLLPNKNIELYLTISFVFLALLLSPIYQQFICLSACLSIYLSIYLCIYVSIYISVYIYHIFIYLFNYLSFIYHLSLYLSSLYPPVISLSSFYM